MTTASQRWQLVRTANLIDRIVLLDGVWTGELAGEIADNDRSSVIDLGKEIAGLVRDLAVALQPVRRWATEDPHELGAVVDRTLQFAEQSPTPGLATELRRDHFPASWAGIVIEAVGILEQDTTAEIGLLEGKLARLERGDSTIGDLRKRYLAAGLIVACVIGCIPSAAILAGVAVSPTAGALLGIAGNVARLGAGMLTLYGAG
jgi:hypothetical protein